MLVCIVCEKVIVRRDTSKLRYGGCSSCSIEEVKKCMAQIEEEEK